jgi:predicted nuclease with RNAse H fold
VSWELIENRVRPNAYDAIMMKTAGVDFASQPKDTAICEIHWYDGQAEVCRVSSNIDDAAICDLVTRVDHLGIDIPLGWPVAFTKALHEYATKHSWPETYDHDKNESFRFRRTDLRVRQDLKLWPLSVSTDRIAIPTMRAASLFASMNPSFARDGSGIVVEVYPAAALKRWNLSWKGYKKPTDLSKRQVMLSEILERLGKNFRMNTVCQEHVVESDDAFDAFIACLVTRAHATGRTDPIPDPEPGCKSLSDKELAKIEGWIAVPKEQSLEQLLN